MREGGGEEGGGRNLRIPAGDKRWDSFMKESSFLSLGMLDFLKFPVPSRVVS